MISKRLQMSLDNQTGSYIRPFLWYGGENKETVAQEIQAIYDSGAREFIVENRGGDWFATDFWWDIFQFILDLAEKMNMRVWCVDDSHVSTGSANDSLTKEENACFRAKNLRMEMVDVAGPLSGGAFYLPERSERESIFRIVAFRRNEVTGAACGEPLDLTDQVVDQLLLADLPEGIWRIYFILNSDPARNRVFQNYITMVSKASCRHLIDEIHEKMYAHFAKYFGNTFAGFFSDEPAFGNCDGLYNASSFEVQLGKRDKMHCWWDDFPQRLAEKNNMSVDQALNYLPALWDDVENISASYRLSYMDMVTGLWEENFSGQLGKWCEEHNVEYLGHNLEGFESHMRTGWGCGHYFRSMTGQHMAGMDIIFEEIIPGLATIPHSRFSDGRERKSSFTLYTLPKLAASLSHIMPHMRSRVICEMFGATGWSCGSANQRAMLSHTLACGVNNYVPHAYSMVVPQAFVKKSLREKQESSHTPPGFCLSFLPPNFFAGGFNPQFRAFCEITRFVQRVANLQENHIHHADVAVHYMAEADWMNAGAYRSMDDVSAKLVRAGYDFDFLPTDTLLNDCRMEQGRLCVNKESYGALILTMTEVMPEAILRKASALAAEGLPVYITDQMPKVTEKGDFDPELLKNIRCAALDDLPASLKTVVPVKFQVQPEQEWLMRYFFTDCDNHKCCILFNYGREDISFRVPGWVDCPVYDPWRNKLFRADGELNLTLHSQQMLVVYCEKASHDLPVYPVYPAAMKPLALKYNIYSRECTDKDGEFKLLREKSAAVNLLVEEKLTRFCGDIRYESEFELDSADFSMLEIPQGGDSAELILNGISCGIAVGPIFRFDIAHAVKAGKNTLQITTWSNPSYVDRLERSVNWGGWFPMRPHGFTGDLFIG